MNPGAPPTDFSGTQNQNINVSASDRENVIDGVAANSIVTRSAFSSEIALPDPVRPNISDTLGCCCCKGSSAPMTSRNGDDVLSKSHQWDAFTSSAQDGDAKQLTGNLPLGAYPSAQVSHGNGVAQVAQPAMTQQG
jgi:hypothetical protein